MSLFNNETLRDRHLKRNLARNVEIAKRAYFSESYRARSHKKTGTNITDALVIVHFWLKVCLTFFFPLFLCLLVSFDATSLLDLI